MCITDICSIIVYHHTVGVYTRVICVCNDGWSGGRQQRAGGKDGLAGQPAGLRACAAEDAALSIYKKQINNIYCSLLLPA